ncbi:MAG: polyribonucleotide nucleotidyltransferase [Coriobacteriales bacterium]|nr:polyribonucleotide nucleotidyltransferase [Coriobacteriales bacterium]
MAKVTEEFDLYGKHYVLETGQVAKQATGACVVKQGDTVVLLTAVVGGKRDDIDFFPLTVDVVERMYAVGRIPGGYIKRETRPSDKGTLMARAIDRPIRPGFPDGFHNDVQIVATIMSNDAENPHDEIGIMGASAALLVGGVPFDGPAAGVCIGRDRETKEWIVNPTYQEKENSDLELSVAGTADYISMVEAGGEEISEEDMLAALEFAQQVLGEFCAAQQRFLDKVNPTPMEYTLDIPDPQIAERVNVYFDEMQARLKGPDKQARKANADALKTEITATFSDEEQAKWGKAIAAAIKSLEKHAMRDMVIATGERVDGRVSTEIRPITTEVGWLPRAHGSGLFTRGQTQVLSVLTLGMLADQQRLDTINPEKHKRYMHQYSFPPYCTGETGRMGAPKRREIGHGALAERALVPVLPSEQEFPYAMRVVSEVLESNGSSSMASTCGSTLALMDGGVPIKRPVAGIAMGLIKEGDDTVILSDIRGIEDFLGDMDFKVCGTERGITALQMDNKAKGLSTEILGRALAQAHEGRKFIMGKMMEALTAPREGISSYAPHVITIQIPTEKIRDVIGSGGKVIRALQEETESNIEVDEDGTVYIASVGEGGEEARRRIELIVKDPEVGEEYTGKVVGIQSFGAFINILPGKDGMLHISKMAQGRIGKVEDVLNLGDEVRVVIADVDPKNGKVSLDRLDKPPVPEGCEAPAPRPRRDGDRDHDRHGHGGRPGGDHRTPRRHH